MKTKVDFGTNNPKCPKGVNPDALKKWREEDHNKKVDAFENLCRALYDLEDLFGVVSESDHPLEKAYELIFNFGDEQGLTDK